MSDRDSDSPNRQVSVVIPFFNRAHCLHRAVDSVLAQTYGDWEIVLVDDGSSDESSGIATGYAERLPDRVRVFRQANQGETAARNKAIREARGALVGILDSDDEWDSRFLERTVGAFDLASDVDWVYVNARRVDEDGTVLVASVFDDDRAADFRRLRTRTLGHLHLIEDPDFLVTAITTTVKAGANSVVKRRVFQAVSYPPAISVGGDRALIIEAIAAGFRFGYVDEVLLTVYHHAGNTSMARATDASKALRAHLQVIRAHEYLDRNVELDGRAKAALREKLGDLYFQYAALLLDSRGSYLTLARYLTKSLAAKPVNNLMVDAVRNRVQSGLHLRR